MPHAAVFHQDQQQHEIHQSRIFCFMMSWVCKQCTLENAVSALECDACGIPVENSWKCVICTVVNPAVSSICSSCNASREQRSFVESFLAPAQEKLALQRELESRAVDPSENAKKAKLEEPFVWSSCSAGGFVHSLFAKESEAKKVNDDELNVMSLNVWFDEAFFEQRVKAQLETMKQMKPDVICLQEVTPNYLKIIMSDVWVQKSMWLSHKEVNGYGVAILSSIIPAGFSNTSLPSVMGRSLLTVQYECQWPAVSTVHLESLGDYQASRVNQLNVIMKSLSLITDLVLCGDFNFDADSAGSIESKAISKEYVDVMPKVPTLGVNYPSKKYGKNRFEKNESDRMLLKSSVWKKESSQVFGEVRLPSLPGYVPANGYLKSRGAFLSDHLGLFAKFVKK